MFSIFSNRSENVESIYKLIKNNVNPLSIKRNDATLVFAIKSEITLSSISIKTVRRCNSFVKNKLFFTIDFLYNRCINFHNNINLNLNLNIIYLKHVIGIPIFLCKLTI
jgi:hypothetical protein